MGAEKLPWEENSHARDELSQIDVERLRYNLSLTPTERYEQHQRALKSVLMMRKALQERRTESDS